MPTTGSFKRVALCITAGALLGIIIGVFLGYLYDTFDEPASMFIMSGLNEVAFGFVFATLGVCMGVLVGAVNLRPLAHTAMGAGVGFLFLVYWFSFVVRVPTEPDKALALAVIPSMTLMGFLLALLRHLLLIKEQAGNDSSSTPEA